MLTSMVKGWRYKSIYVKEKRFYENKGRRTTKDKVGESSRSFSDVTGVVFIGEDKVKIITYKM